MMRIKTWLDILVTGAIVTACVFIIRANWDRVFSSSARRPLKVPGEAISTDGVKWFGGRAVPRVVIIFSDFQCPFCRQFASGPVGLAARQMLERGEINIGFRHLPLTTIHPLALSAARSAECAAAAHEFVAAHDWLFGSAPLQEAISTLAAGVGIDPAQLQRCVDSSETERAVERDVSHAKSLGVTTTPSFLFGTIQPNGTVVVSAVIAGVMDERRFRDALSKTAPSR